MNVVVVESPAKAKTINKYLGRDYTVLASYGHVRDLPAKNGSVRPDEDFSMSWESDPKAEKRIDDIANALTEGDHLYLATDPDREGEAISWHVRELLAERNVLAGVDVQRVVFNEITKDAVLEAMRNPRDLNNDLIEAYLARRALDYLVGFTLSPVLWRKLPGSRSAGRVQSVALRLICEREAEIEVFKPREYWSVETDFTSTKGATVTARLTHLGGDKLDKFGLPDEAAAKAAYDDIARRAFHVAEIERKQARRNPQPPFTTSTLQQEASRKLGFGATRTMRTAQRLYEGIDIGGETVGLISYMRTDSVTMAKEAVTAIRDMIGKEYGADHVPDAPRTYKTKAKAAQEAHEAIRPTDVTRRARDLEGHLDKDQLRLYRLIWQRAVASQMASAVLDQVAVDFASEDAQVVLRATGSVVVFPGFFRLYHEDQDDNTAGQDETKDRILPPLEEKEAVDRGETRPEQHFTQPPPRYTEASLVKKMEELGIGRPSTYASILQVLQDRNYVELDKKRFTPEDRGRVVTAFLESFFKRYVQYDFTADLEMQLDHISGGFISWKTVLHDFWDLFHESVDKTKDLKIRDVLDALDADLGPHFFTPLEDGSDPRACPKCDGGRLGLKLGKFGAFIGCANYPDCKYTRKLAVNGSNGQPEIDERLLGQDPKTSLSVYVRQGPYGFYVQLGENGDKKEEKPKRASIPKGADPATLDLDTALSLLALPRDVGAHPEDGEMITAGIGRYGPYIKHESTYTKVESLEDVLTIGLNRAVALLKEAPKRGGRNGALRSLGDHPDDGKPVTVHSGRYGPYVKHGKINATIPDGREPDEITLDEALPLLAARQERLGKGKPAKKPAKKAAKKPKAGAPSKARKASAAPKARKASGSSTTRKAS